MKETTWRLIKKTWSRKAGLACRQTFTERERESNEYNAAFIDADSLFVIGLTLSIITSENLYYIYMNSLIW